MKNFIFCAEFSEKKYVKIFFFNNVKKQPHVGVIENSCFENYIATKWVQGSFPGRFCEIVQNSYFPISLWVSDSKLRTQLPEIYVPKIVL